jgi:hypothetical protein
MKLADQRRERQIKDVQVVERFVWAFLVRLYDIIHH